VNWIDCVHDANKQASLRMLKLRNKGWAERLARMKLKRNICVHVEIWPESQKEEDQNVAAG
jgi:hypothetical protein